MDYRTIPVGLMAAAVLASSAFAADGNAERGQRVFAVCAACHSLNPNQNMTGPSLAGLWGRKAGSLSSFTRYSPALKSSGIVWNDKTLDSWIKSPQQLVPGNAMTFPGIKDAQARADLLAFLKEATELGHASSQSAQSRPMGGMRGMTEGGQVPNLKQLAPSQRVQSITYCRDTYRVATVDGKQHVFWERNLRLKTDSGADGPHKNAPALVSAGMVGDRADVIFADPAEISPFIRAKCE